MCVSCALIRPIQDNAERYAVQVFDALAPGTARLFSAFVGLWMLTVVFKLLKAELSVQELMAPVLTFSLITILLNTHQGFWEYVYQPITRTLLNLFNAVIQVNAQGPQNLPLEGLLSAVETSILKVLGFCKRVTSTGGWADLGPMITGFCLSIPFLFLWARFVVITVEYCLILLAVSALAPLWIASCAFKATRRYGASALTLVLQAALTVCLSVIAMSVTLKAVEVASAQLHLSAGDSSTLERLGAFSKETCGLFILSIASIMFQLKAAALASAIMQGGSGLFGSSVLGNIAHFKLKPPRSSA